MNTKKWIIIALIFLMTISFVILDALYIKPHNLTVREETISSNKIQDVKDDLLIAYFSDLHYGLYTNSSDLELLVETINNYDPDIVLFAGDLFDNYQYLTSEDKEYVLNKFKEINASINKFYVVGEKDLISESVKETVINLLNEADFKLLDNENVSIYKDNKFYLNIIGIDSNSQNIDEAFNGVDTNAYNLVIAHYPDSILNLDTNLIDYYLAGHSHGIQIYVPLINYFYRPYGANKYFRGKYYKNNTTIDVTSGVGLKEKSIRLFSDAEVVFYKISAN